jgi:RNA polymerase sigma-70 factor (ECF subfamily)
MVTTDDQLAPSDCQEFSSASPGREDRLSLLQNDLLSQACTGNTQAFDRLTGPQQARLLRQAAALTGDLSAAEDLVSETLVEAWKCLPRYDRSCRLSTWLYAILLHRHYNALRRARSRPFPLAWLSFFDAQDCEDRQANLPATEPSPAATLAQNELNARVRQSVAHLPEKHRQVILLRFFEDASLPDMAAVLGCSVGTVKSRLHHALDKLRKMKMNLSELAGDKQI